jgi:hypothetical protein
VAGWIIDRGGVMSSPFGRCSVTPMDGARVR